MPRSIAHYTIIESLGEGGMGQVYLAEDTRLERRIALKVLAPHFATDADSLARFQREAKAIAALNHPNIVTIYSVEEVDEYRFFTMELIEGQTLDGLIPAEGMALEQLLELGAQLAEALRAAHERGITHRDLKPANVMVTAEGRVKVLDFGLAKLLQDGPEAAKADDLLKTQDGRVLGTAPYMSPEQIRGTGVDRRSDIFALGILLFEMATGERPFRGKSWAELMSKILRDPSAPVSRLRASCPPHLDRIIDRCLEKDPARRFQNGGELSREIEALRDEISFERALAKREASGERRRVFERRGWFAFLRQPRLLLTTRLGLALVLVLLFAVNLAETWIETWLRESSGLGLAMGYGLAETFHSLEGRLSFEQHDMTSPLAVYGYSVAYFFLTPLVGLAMAFVLALRRELTPFRVFCCSIVAAYAISLPFFLFFPGPERWVYPPAEATLLSDQWTV
ncbi:MAG: serine/threonine-protein kinase, partial [Acidobacteriota bacterium]